MQTQVKDLSDEQLIKLKNWFERERIERPHLELMTQEDVITLWRAEEGQAESLWLH